MLVGEWMPIFCVEVIARTIGIREKYWVASQPIHWALCPPFRRRGGRVVECARLEIGCAARYRGFESLPLRHWQSKINQVFDS